MTVYRFDSVLVWNGIGGAVSLASGQVVTVLNPDAPGGTAPGLTQGGVPVPWVTSDSEARVSFTATIRTVDIVSSSGLRRQVTSPDAFAEATTAATSAASAATSSAASATAAAASAALVGAPSKAAMDAAMGGDVAGLTTKVVYKNGADLDVHDFGAKGDNIQDDSPAFAAAMAALPASGGRIRFRPKMTYWLNTFPEMRDDVVIDLQGATLIKDVRSIDPYIFVGLSNRGTGYGSGPSRWVLRNGTLKGDFYDGVGTYRSCAISLHHCDDILIENIVWEQAITNAHVLDMGACRNVTIRDCKIMGYRQTGQGYVEAIQLDWSIAVGVPVDRIKNPTSYDGLACQNIVVERVQCLPLKVGAITYPAPNLIGSHSCIDGRWNKNVIVRDCLIQDGYEMTGSGFRGWIHGYAIDGMLISGCKFVNTVSRAATPISFHQTPVGTILADVTDPAAAAKTLLGGPMACHNVTVENCTFEGFNNTNTSQALINIQGASASSSRGMRVVGNRAINCYPGTTPSANGPLFVNLEYGTSATVVGNYADKIRGLCTATNSPRTMILDNNVDTVYFNLCYFPAGSDGGTIKGNNVTQSYSGILVGASNTVITGNNIAGSTGTGNQNLIQASGAASGTIISGNVLQASGVGTAPGTGIFMSGSKGRAVDNIVLGTYGAAPVSVTGTDITQSGNVVT